MGNSLNYKRLYMKKGDRKLVLLIWVDLGVPFYYPIRLLAIINHLEAQGWERIIENYYLEGALR